VVFRVMSVDRLMLNVSLSTALTALAYTRAYRCVPCVKAYVVDIDYQTLITVSVVNGELWQDRSRD